MEQNISYYIESHKYIYSMRSRVSRLGQTSDYIGEAILERKTSTSSNGLRNHTEMYD